MINITTQPPEKGALQDNFGRNFSYLRLSITDICNFRCNYCLPNGYQPCGKNFFLTTNEIKNLVAGFAELGIKKIRITGGEPTIRKDFTQIISVISEHPQIKQLAFTTNGYRLLERAEEWYKAGLTHINVSVDSLDKDRFHAITGHNRLPEILAGINKSLEVGFRPVKINVVLLKGVNDIEIDSYLSWIKTTPITIRFIELMQTGNNAEYFRKYHISTDYIIRKLEQSGWVLRPRQQTSGPAQEYTHSNYAGSIGIIAPYAKDFCKSCNRLRVTSNGDLRLCLFGSSGISLRHLLQHEEQKPLLKQLISKQLAYKESSHFLAYGYTGDTKHLASVGG